MAIEGGVGDKNLGADRAATALFRHFVYWILPALVSVGLVLAYFSGIEPLRNLVASPLNREFGVLEHLQSGILLVATIGGVMGLRRACNGVEKAVSALITVGAAFILLEEVDFGLHYWEYVFGETGITNLNIHNQEGTLKIFKSGGDLVTVLLFIVIPIVGWRISNPRIAYFIPDRLIAITVLAGFAVSQLAHVMDDAGLYLNGPLDHNISEFRETFTYYAFMLYGLDLALRRRWPMPTGDAGQPG